MTPEQPPSENKMRSFKSFLTGVENDPSRDSEEKKTIFHCRDDDLIARLIVERVFLPEARKSVDLGQGKMIYFHKAHIPDTEDHLHFAVKGAKLYSLNKNGTAHDRSHGQQMARWAMDAVKDFYPDFTLPKDGLIEELMPSDGELLTEAHDARQIVSRADMLIAVSRAS